MPLITVFTPTYNRKHTLPRVYASLLSQTCYDFLWLVIDDGSTDGTRELIEEYQARENPFAIEYCYKTNGGLHTGYNKAIELSHTELMLCLDSDDFLPVDCINDVSKRWEESKDEKLAGVIGLDYDTTGKVIGDRFPDQDRINLVDICVGKYKVKGDKKYAVRTDLYRKVAPMPVIKGEKNFNPHYMVLKISQDHDFLVLNKNLCFVDYQKEGMSANMWKQYHNSPNSFAEIRRLYLSFSGASFSYYFKNATHFVSSCLLSKQKGWLKNVSRKAYVVFAFPFGVIFSILVEIMAKR